MNLTPAQAAASCLAFFASLVVYAWLGRRIASRGGRVASELLGIPDIFVCTLFFFWFALLIAAASGRPAPRVIHTRDVIHSALFELAVVAALCGFLKYRRIRLVELFGLRRIAVAKAVGLAVLFLLAAYPLIGLATLVSQHLTGGKAPAQEIVQFFLEVSKKSDRRSVIITLVMGILVAPVSEELIFRGYIYAAIKRYLGIPAGILLNAALFAAVHLDVAALVPLFVLALCFSLVYEATGSLLVSTTMHSLFNLVTFLALAALSAAPK